MRLKHPKPDWAMANAALRLGALGNARILENALLKPSHGRVDLRVAAIGSRRAAAGSSAGLPPHGIALVSGYDAVVDNRNVDAVYVALPMALHATWVERALAADKHVLCEKPLSLDPDVAHHLHAMAADRNLVLITGYHNARHPNYVRFIDSLRSEGPAKIDMGFLVDVPFTPDEIRYRSDLQGGALADLGCYLLRALYDLRPKAQIVTIDIGEWTWSHGVDKSALLTLGLDSGDTLRLAVSFAHDGPLDAWVQVRNGSHDRRFDHLIEPHLADAPGKATRTSYSYQLDHFLMLAARGEPAPAREVACDIAIADAISRIVAVARDQVGMPTTHCS